MTTENQSRLTFAELLLTTAVVAVLASLLLPVFARARDEARQAVCLGNVRTIAQALCMYLTETDGRLPPVEYNPQVLAYFNTYPGGAGADQWDPARPALLPCASVELVRSRAVPAGLCDCPVAQPPGCFSLILPGGGIW